MASTDRVGRLVTLLNEDGFQDGYWCEWVTIEFPDFEFDWNYKREVLEPIVRSVKFEDYDFDRDEDIPSQVYLDKLEDAFREKGFTVKIEPAAFVFVGQ